MPSRSLNILLALPSLALAVTLSDFTPRVSNLPASCSAVYTAPILGCSASDFTPAGCSSGCISALQNLVPFVQAACSNAGVTGNNPLNAFLTGDGPHSICANAPSATTATTSSSTSTTSTTDAPTTTQAPPTTTSTSTPDATTSSTSTSTSTSTTSSTSSPPSTLSTSSAGKTSTTSAAAKTTSAASTTTASSSAAFGLGGASSTTSSTSSTTTAATTGGSNSSGGGSPFDTVNHGAASSVLVSVQQVVFGVAGALIMLL